MKKLLRNIFIVLIAIFGIAIMYAYIAFPAEYVNRVLRWGDADVFDYQKFPEREIFASITPLKLPKNYRGTEIYPLLSTATGIEDFNQFLAQSDTQAFIVLKDGEIVIEDYFNGYARDSIVTSFSVAKSFASALIGIAIEDGYIHSIQDPITNYIPELLEKDERFRDISVRDLLLMSSGIRYDEFPFVNGDDAKTYYYPDLRELALEDTEINQKPEREFHYNNFHPLLLGMILERATNMSVSQYLEENIWHPMGAEYDAGWSMDEHGFEKMESGINARAIDFAKFGQLYLDGGFINGKQVIPTEWVEKSTMPQDRTDYSTYYYDDFIFDDGAGYYQYLWWGLEKDLEHYDFIAIGNHGQFIYVSPQSGVVILRFGESYGVPGGAQDWLEIMSIVAAELSGNIQ